MDKCRTEVKFLSLYAEDDTGWFSARYFNGLFSIDFTTGETKYIGQFPEKKSVAIYRSVVSCKDELYFIPSQGDVIGVYDRAADLITCINIPQCILDRLYFDRFAFAFEYSENIYMFGLNSAIVLKLDVVTKVLTEISIFEDCESVGSFSWLNYVMTEDNKIYALINNAKEIIEITLEDFSYRILTLSQVNGRLTALAKRECSLWIADTKGGLFEYDLKSEKSHKYSMQNDCLKPDEETGQFSWYLYSYESKIYMLAGLNHASLIFDTETKCFQKNDKFVLEPHKKYPFGTCDAGQIWFLPVVHNNRLYFQWEADLTLRILDLRDNRLRILPILIEKKYYTQVLLMNGIKRNGIVVEAAGDYPFDYSLDLYLDTLLKDSF